MNFNDFKSKYCPMTPLNPAEVKIEGWGSKSIAFEYVINQVEPESIIEVGSWLGASAIHMASLSKSSIICVDTFLGSNEILWRDNVVQNVVQDFDRIYKQFCANITSLSLNHQISCLPMTSSSAAELFANTETKADVVYIDAGHRFREVYADLQDWWPLTNKALIGDDYSSEWPGVVEAANQFANENDLSLQLLDSKFLLFR